MRILHTADWHLNHRLDRVSLNRYLHAAVRQIAGYLDEHRVDVLVIAGDLFDGREGREQLKDSIAFLKETFTPFLQRGGTVLTISGNHDSEAFFETLRDAFDLVAPATKDDTGVFAPGRFYITPNPMIRSLRGASGQAVQFVLMPYPTPRAYLSGERVNYKNIEERNQAMAQTYREFLERLQERLDTKLPAVLVTHGTVRGVSENDFFQPSDANDVLIETTDLPSYFACGLFGHIHRAQPVQEGGTKFWYCGSLIPLDAGERTHQKGVVLCEVGQGGLVGAPITLPIAGPNLYDLIITPDEIETLRERYPDCDTAILKYTLKYDQTTYPDPYPQHRKIRAVFPNWYGGDSIAEGAAETAGAATWGAAKLEDIRGTVLEYLRDAAQFTAADAPKEAVLTLAEEILSDSTLITNLRSGRR